MRAADARVAVQGFGSAGYHTARVLSEMGHPVVAVSDLSGAVFSDKGLDVESLHAEKEASRKGVYCECGVCDCDPSFGERIPGDDLLALDVEVLVPAAIENAITTENATRVKAGVVVEVANAAVAPGADEVLAAQGALVLPDVLCNAGGVTGSWFEWRQNLQGSAWPASVYRRRLEERMRRAFQAVWHLSERKRLPLRDAAWRIALQAVAGAARAAVWQRPATRREAERRERPHDDERRGRRSEPRAILSDDAAEEVRRDGRDDDRHGDLVDRRVPGRGAARGRHREAAPQVRSRRRHARRRGPR